MSILSKALRFGAVAAAIAVAATFTTSAVAGEKGKTAKVGHEAPHFMLKDLEGNTHVLSDYLAEGKIVVLEWFNPMCPYVVKHHAAQDTMAALHDKYEKDIVWLAINSAHEGHMTYAKADKPMEVVKKWDLDYPVLVDATGEVGKMYGARTTPHMYIIDSEGILRYAGGIDDHKGARAPAEGTKVTNYVDVALQQILAGETVSMAETKAYGCSVKYGN